MIRRRTMLEEPDVAPDGTWCYFLSSTTLADFDISAELAERSPDRSPFDKSRDFKWNREDCSPFLDECGIHWLDQFLFTATGTSRMPSQRDDLILWPTEQEVFEFHARQYSAGMFDLSDTQVAERMRAMGYDPEWAPRWVVP